MAELLLSLTLLLIVVLTVLGLSVTILRSGQDSADTTTAVAVAESELQRAINAAQADSNFWDLDHKPAPYSTTTVTSNRTDFECVVYAVTVNDGANPLGTSTGLAENRLKQVDIVVTWWDSDTQRRQGYSKLEVRQSRLVSELNE